MMLPNKIEKLVKKMCYKATGEAYDKTLDSFLRAVERYKEQHSASDKPILWRTIMKSPVTKLVAAAVIIIAFVIGLSLWRTTGSGIALADVLARVEQVKTYRFKMSLTGYNTGKTDRDEFRGTVVMSQEYGYKGNLEVRDPNDGWETVGERYFYPHKKTIVQIAHPMKTYFRWEFDDAEVQWNQDLLSQYSNPGALLRDIMACKHETLGRSSIDGVEVEGFRTTDPNCRSSFSRSLIKDPQAEHDVKIWVDVKTRLPVRCEDLASGLDEMGNPSIAQSITTDFEGDVPVTAAEFDPPHVPDGYEVVDKRPEPSDEEVAIQGLRQCVELFGNYLETIGDGTESTEVIFLAIEKSETPAALRLKEELKGWLTEDEKLDRIRSAGWPLRRLIWFYVRLIQDKKDPAYYGKTVTPKDSDKVLLRWKLSENKYRVIYGDLRVETISPEKLAELENPVRQPSVKMTPASEQKLEPAQSIPYAGGATTGVKEEESSEPVNDPIKVHSVWEGTCDQTGWESYPMILFIQNRKGKAFEATIWYPTLGNGLVKTSGQVNPEGLVTFTEKQVIHGERYVMSGARFTATIEGNNLKGGYVIKLPFGKVDGGNISLKLSD